MNRFDRITAILIQLQAKRLVSGPTLAEQFDVSLRTIYRNLHTLELAGVPLHPGHSQTADNYMPSSNGLPLQAGIPYI